MLSICMETDRLKLRPFAAGDEQAIYALGLEVNKVLWLPDWAMNEEQARGFIQWATQCCQEPDPARKPMIWAVVRKDSGELIGFCGVGPKEELGGEVELAYAISGRHAGHGMATEAARAVIWWAMEQAQIAVIVAIVQKDNTASLKVLRKLGFIEAGSRMLDDCGKRRDFIYLRLYHLDFLSGPEWQLPTTAEEMAAFFDYRANGYEAHMKQDPDFEMFYSSVAAPIRPTDEAIHVLDLGCGTGLELRWLFEKAPNARVTCLDLSPGMLEKLRENYHDKLGQIETVQASYVDWDYPPAAYDYSLSVNTMHHYLEQRKLGIYQKVLSALKPGGVYIEADYMVDDIMMEQYRRRYYRIMDGLGGADSDFYHVDIPFTPVLQKHLLYYAGFSKVYFHMQRIQTEWSGAIVVAERAEQIRTDES